MVGMEMLPYISQGISQQIGAATGAMQSLYGFWQTMQADKMMKELEKNRPQRSTDPNYLYNQKIAQTIASQGIPDYAKNYYSDAIDRQLQSGISAIQMGGGDINQISGLTQNSSNEYNKMMASDVQQKLKNQEQLIAANTAVAKQNMMNWDYNVNIPFQQRYARATQMSNAGMQNVIGGLNRVGQVQNAGSTMDWNAINNSLQSQGYGSPAINANTWAESGSRNSGATININAATQYATPMPNYGTDVNLTSPYTGYNPYGG